MWHMFHKGIKEVVHPQHFCSIVFFCICCIPEKNCFSQYTPIHSDRGRASTQVPYQNGWVIYCNIYFVLGMRQIQPTTPLNTV